MLVLVPDVVRALGAVGEQVVDDQGPVLDQPGAGDRPGSRWRRRRCGRGPAPGRRARRASRTPPGPGPGVSSTQRVPSRGTVGDRRHASEPELGCRPRRGPGRRRCAPRCRPRRGRTDRRSWPPSRPARSPSRRRPDPSKTTVVAGPAGTCLEVLIAEGDAARLWPAAASLEGGPAPVGQHLAVRRPLGHAHSPVTSGPAAAPVPASALSVTASRDDEQQRSHPYPARPP